MLAIAVPTPEEINAYAVALGALALAIGGVGAAIVAAAMKVKRALDDNTDATRGSTEAHLAAAAPPVVPAPKTRTR